MTVKLISRTIWFLVPTLLLAFTACKTSSKATKASKPGKGKLTEMEQYRADELFFNANKEAILGNYEEAVKLFSQCLSIDKTNAAAHYELARILFDVKSYNAAIASVKSAIAIDKKNVWYKLLLAEAYGASGQAPEAVKVFETVAKENPTNVEYQFNLAEMYLRSGRADDALKVLDRLENQVGVAEEVIMAKKVIFISQNNLDKAAAEMEKLIKANPTEMGYLLELADMYQVNQRPDKAMEIYKRILDIDPTNGPVRLSLANYYRDKGDKVKSFEELKLAFESPAVDIDTKIKVLLSYYTLSERDETLKTNAYQLLDRLIVANNTDAKAFSIYGDFLYRDEKYKEAADKFKKVVELDNGKYIVWVQLLDCLNKLNQTPEVYTYSKQAVELFPTQPTLYLYKGTAALIQKNYPEAIETLSDGYNLVLKDKELETEFLARLGDALYANKNFDKAFDKYEKALELDPTNVYVLNNYSYYLSLRKEKLARAKDLARTVVTLVPDNPSYLDTYAWAFYAAGEYQEAKNWLDKALTSGGKTNGAVLEHMGDALYKLGQVTEANEYWKKAKEAGNYSDLLDIKIEQKKLVE